ncbi:MAG: type II toxin-antitoxin system RelE/ParE family toxin [Acidobacteria bacterium]|nr:type II toxin-antitoxin system RelE/ParE family toxin [Acidobacteriota bacterium]
MSGEQARYFPAAGLELEEAFEWYLERSLKAAEEFLLEIDRALAVIAAAPRIWPQFEAGTRRFVLRQFPYSIIFREADSAIEVVAVAHHKRRPRYWYHRLKS